MGAMKRVNRVSFAATAVAFAGLILAILRLGDPVAVGDRVTDAAPVQVALQSWFVAVLATISLLQCSGAIGSLGRTCLYRPRWRSR